MLKIAIFIIRKIYHLFYILPQDIYFYLRALFGISKEIEYEGNHIFGNKICLFAPYLIGGKISNSLKRYLTHLNRYGYSIIIVSNLDINTEDILWLKSLCTRIVIRDNFGRDFGAYKTGLLKYQKQIQAANELLIANDSVIMIKDLNPMFDEAKSKNVDFWGVSESYCGMYTDHHICSYFISISKQIIESKIFWTFWKNYKLTNSRIRTIKRGEILLSQTLLKAGFKLYSYMNSENINQFLLEQKDNVWFFLHPLEKPSTTNVILEQYRKCLYSTNHNGIFAKAMLAMGLPLIKKDLLMKCHYLLYDIQKILNKNPYLDEVTEELLPIKYRSITNKIQTAIGEK